MKFTYENQGSSTYLVYEIAENDVVDSMSFGMLTNNKIDGLIPLIYTQMNESQYLKYNVTAKISVRQMFEGAVNKKRLIGVFRGIVNAMLSVEDYMIDPASVILDLDYVFADVSSCETALVCLPLVTKEQGRVDLGQMFKNIVFNTQFDKTENCDYVANLINYLNGSGSFSLKEFKEVLDEIEGKKLTKKTEETQSAVVQNTYSFEQPRQVQQPIQPQTPMQQQAEPKVQTHSAAPAPEPVRPAPTSGKAQAAPKQGFATPQSPKPQSPKPQPQTAPQMQSASDEKQIGLMTLLMHYNKENKELYKSQKAEKKGKKGQQTPKQAQVQPATGGSFAIPGQEPSPEAALAQQKQEVPPQQGTQPRQISRPQSKPPRQASQTSAQPQQASRVQQNLSEDAAVQQGGRYAFAQNQSGQANFGETTVLGMGGNIGETTVLGVSSVQAMTQPYLLRTKTHEKIVIDKPVFRIGKERSFVDYFIGDNSAISRCHVNILEHDKRYFVVDTNSTNHTYVNGKMVQSNTEIAIESGARIQLANEEFEFFM